MIKNSCARIGYSVQIPAQKILRDSREEYFQGIPGRYSREEKICTIVEWNKTGCLSGWEIPDDPGEERSSVIVE